VEPWLADSYEVNDDLTEWTIHLKTGPVFHDGSPVTADAVAYTYERALALQAGHSWMWSTISDENTVTVIDDQTIRFTLTEPFAPFISTLGYLQIVNPAVVQEHEEGDDWGSAWLLDHEAGSGPYTIARWEPGVVYELEAVPDYWGGWPSETNPDIFRYSVYREAAPARLALEAGDVDWIVNISEEDAVQLETKQDFTIESRDTVMGSNLFFNTASDGPVGDVNVRKALAHAFNYADVEEVVWDIQAANSFVPISIPGAVEFPDLQLTDLDLAKEYLAESSWPDGGFEVDLIYLGGFARHEDYILIAIDSLSQLGIQINPVSVTWSELVAKCGEPETVPDMVFVDVSVPYPEVYPLLARMFDPAAQNSYPNCHRYLVPEIADLIAQIPGERDEATRMALYEEIQGKIHDAQPGIYIGLTMYHEAHSNHWQASARTPLYGYIEYISDFYYVP
jgi:peptide/nickel transport system substrate-binding protein